MRRIVPLLTLMLVLVVTLLAMATEHPKYGLLCAHVISGPCSSTGGYRASRLQDLVPIRDSTLIIVAFSGGGTRAAAFGYGVLRGLDSLRMEESLRKETLLDRVGIVAGVSGGAFTAAHFALFGRAGFADFENNFLFAQHLALRLLAGYAIEYPIRRLQGRYSTSDYASEQWNRVLFHGKTFGDLEQESRIFLLIHATEFDRQAVFPFVQERFDPLCSNLSALPIARAVAASSAFPAMLSPITVENYSRGPHLEAWGPHGEACGNEDPPSDADEVVLVSGDLPKSEDSTSLPCGNEYALHLSTSDAADSAHRYFHLVDGGIADNLGVCTLMRGLDISNPVVPLRKLVKNKVRKLVLILVDAGTSTTPASERERPPGPVEELGQVLGEGIAQTRNAVLDDLKHEARARVALKTGLNKDQVVLVPLTLLECSPGLTDPVNSMRTSFGLKKAEVRRLIDLGEKCAAGNIFLQDVAAPYRTSSTFSSCSAACADSMPPVVVPSVIKEPVQFKHNYWTISSEAAHVLERKAPWLKQHPEARIRLEGNSDEYASDEVALRLGQIRAISVQRYLVEHFGIDERRFDLVSYGEERPVCTEHNITCWDLNSRVDFVIVSTFRAR